MKFETALKMQMLWSGEYDLPGQFLTVKGIDAWGREIEEKIPAIDHERFDREYEENVKFFGKPSD
jgi:hypothetical protein